MYKKVSLVKNGLIKLSQKIKNLIAQSLLSIISYIKSIARYENNKNGYYN